MNANDISQIVLAACAVVGLVGVLVGLGFGYGAFRGRALAMADAQKDATKRIFQRLERAERIAEDARDALIEGGLAVPSGTQAGADGRGVRIRDLPKG